MCNDRLRLHVRAGCGATTALLGKIFSSYFNGMWAFRFWRQCIISLCLFFWVGFLFSTVHFAPQGVVYFCSLRSRVNVCVPSISLVDI